MMNSPERTPKPQPPVPRAEVRPASRVRPLVVEGSADVAVSLKQLRDPNADLDEATLELIQRKPSEP